ncbi:MAG: MFS transporter [Nocardioidaceae bacterium]
MTARAERLILSHGLSAIAMAMPWPALLAAVWAQTHSEGWLAVAGAARMAPYVLLSWAAGSLGDRFARTAVVKVSTALRLGLLSATALLLATDQVFPAVATATLAVAVGTPAYPALAAGLPDLAGDRQERATRWLVTLEVSAFVVGPAVGGLLLGLGGASLSTVVASALAIGALVALVGIDVGTGPATSGPTHESGPQSLRVLLATPGAVRAIIAVAVVNGVVGALGVGLLSLAEDGWGVGEREFGLATAALGFGALATPAICWALRLPPTAVAAALVLTAAPLGLTAFAPAWWWALLPLGLVGAGATQVECAVTGVIQRSVPDHARAFALGVTDTAMVTVALAGAAAAPPLAAAVTPAGLVIVLTLVTAAATAIAWLPDRAAPRAPQPAPSTSAVIPHASAETTGDVGLGSLV